MDIDVQTARFGMVATFLAMIPCVILGEVTDLPFFEVLGYICVAALIFFMHFNRCPYCKRGFGRYNMFGDYCPHCGEHL